MNSLTHKSKKASKKQRWFNGFIAVLGYCVILIVTVLLGDLLGISTVLSIVLGLAILAIFVTTIGVIGAKKLR